MAERFRDGRRPRWPALPRGRRARAVALAAAYLALTAVFAAAGFPTQRLAPRVAAALEAATGARVALGRLEPGFVLLGPQLRAYDVEVVWPGGFRLRFDRARVRPAWSLSWFTGEPSLALALRSDLGEVDGTARLGAAPAFHGTVSGLALGRLPQDVLGAGVRLEGSLDADVDLRVGPQAPEGELALRARAGSLSLPSLPIGIPFERLDGDLALGGDSMLTLHSVALEGPLVALRGNGRVGQAAEVGSAPLALEVRIEAREPALRQLLAAQGIALGPDGGADLAIGGTLGEPVVRPGARGGASPPAAAAGTLR